VRYVSHGFFDIIGFLFAGMVGSTYPKALSHFCVSPFEEPSPQEFSFSLYWEVPCPSNCSPFHLLVRFLIFDLRQFLLKGCASFVFSSSPSASDTSSRPPIFAFMTQTFHRFVVTFFSC